MNEWLAQLARLPAYGGWHVLLTLIALAVGIAISLPLGIFVARRGRFGAGVITTASIIQTIPSMAMLALMFPLLVVVRDLLPEQAQFRAIGFWPTIIALTLYSLLPMLRNTVTGIQGVDPAMIEAARGLGMTPAQMLWRVELPLAAPVIIAGVRTATVWTVGVATLSTPIGQTSLGNYIFGGLQTQNLVAILVGCIAAAVLAVALDLLIAGLQRAMQQRSRALGLVCGIGLAAVLLTGIAGWASTQSWGDGRPRAIVGAKNFPEQFILAEVMADRLRGAGYDVTKLENLGSLNAFNALAAGEIDAYVDYSGTIWANAMGRTDLPGRAQVLEEMTDWLAETHGIVMLGQLGFENAYALAMRESAAAERNLATIDDLAPYAPQLRFGSDIEFFDRPEWAALRETYGLDFAQLVPMTPTLMYPAVAEGEVDVITAFTSDGRIAAFKLRTLEDTRGALPPYDAVLLLSERAAEDPQLVAALRPLVGAIDVVAMRQANLMVDVEKASVNAAADWLSEQVPERGDD